MEENNNSIQESSLWKTILFILAILFNSFETVKVLSNQGSEHPLLFGLSLHRIALIGIVLIISTIIIFFLFHFYSKKSKIYWRLIQLIDKHTIQKTFFWLLLLSYFSFLAGTLPPYRLGIWKGYWEIITPIFTYFAATLLILFFYLFITHPIQGIPKYDNFFQHIRSRLFLILGIVLTVLGILFYFHSSLPKDQYYWNVAGVPILPEYVYLVFGIFFFLPLFSQTYKTISEIKINLLFVLLALFFITNSIFQQQPVTRNFFIETRGEIPIRYIPNSDARYYDISGRAFINGLGVDAGRPSDKPLFEAYAGILHFLMGDEYEDMMKLNIFILAFIPVFLLLIGKLLDSDEFGLWLALFSIFFELSTFKSSGYIANIHWKLLMPEPISQLVIIFITMTTLLWLRHKKQEKWLYITGLAIGIGAYIRPTTSFLLPGFLLVILLSKSESFKQRMFTVAKVFSSFLLTVLPWAIYCYFMYGYIPLISKFQWIQNYRFSLASFISSESPKFVHFPFLSMAGSLSIVDMPEKLYIIFSHFLNNIIKALLILPNQVEMNNIPEIFANTPYWTEGVNWNGQVSLLFIVSVFVFSIGVSQLVRTKNGIGLIPLLYMLFYFLALAISRTSGSRYIVPVIWVIYLYYFLGIITLAKYFLSKLQNPVPHNNQIVLFSPRLRQEKLSVYYLLPSFIFGLLFPIMDYSIPLNRNLYLSQEGLFELQTQSWIYDELSISEQEWHQVIHNKIFLNNFGKMTYSDLKYNSEKNSYEITFDLVGNLLLKDGYFSFENMTDEEATTLQLDSTYFIKSCTNPGDQTNYPFILVDVEQNEHYINLENWNLCLSLH